MDSNWIDYTVLGIFVLSVMIGFARGLIREVISLLIWVAAFIVASVFSNAVAAKFTSTSSYQHLLASASGSIGDGAAQHISMLAVGASFVGLFVVTLIVGSIINRIISYAVESSGISIVNRLLGGAFGFGRGCLMGLIILFLFSLMPVEQSAAWTTSKSVEIFKPGVEWLSNIINPQIEGLKSQVTDKLKNVNIDNVKESIKNTYDSNQSGGSALGNMGND
jgi:membrane protein required for colicin V production